jgi:hypothetical protein
MISFTCSSCGRKFKIADQHAGKRVKCSGCAQVVQLPATSAAAPGKADAPQAGAKSPRPPRDEAPADTTTLPPPDAEATVDRPAQAEGGKPSPGAAPPPAIPGYEIQQVLGRGGMGVIYLARQERPDRLVALKMILAGDHASADELARFHAEAELAARLQHPNIVAVHEVGRCQGRPYLTLEYVEGGSLAGYLKGHKKLKPRQAAELLHQLARAVQFAHKRGVLHRDLKPGNILLAPHPDGEDEPLPWVPKITDFGLAKQLAGMAGAAAGPRTQTGTILGTPRYMAPEQVKAKKGKVGPAADVYALGAILYEVLTGKAPFDEGSTVDILLQVASREPTPPRKHRPKIPRDLETICLKCLQKDPARRYASALELAEDLRRFLDGKPTQARPEGVLARATRFLKRRKELTFLAGGVLLALCLGVVVLAVWRPFGRAAPGPQPGTRPGPQTQLPPDLQLVPQDGGVFVSVQVGELWKRTGLLKQAKQFVQDLVKQPELVKYQKVLEQQEQEFQEATGLRSADAERVTVSLSLAKLLRGGPGGIRYVLTTSRPYDWGKLKAAFPKLLGPCDEQEYRGKKALIPRQAVLAAICAFNDRTLLFTDGDIRPILDQHAAAPEQEGPLRKAVELAAGKHLIVVGVNPARKDLAKIFEGKPAAWQALAELDAASLALDLPAADGPESPLTGFQAELVLSFVDEAAAGRGQKAAQALLSDFLTRLKQVPELQQVPGLQKIFLDPLAAASWKQEGTTARLVLHFQWQESEMQSLLAFLQRKMAEAMPKAMSK